MYLRLTRRPLHGSRLTVPQNVAGPHNPWSLKVKWVMEPLWLLTVFFVPLAFVNPGIISISYDVPKVTLYRSIVGLMTVLLVIEWGFTHH